MSTDVDLDIAQGDCVDQLSDEVQGEFQTASASDADEAAVILSSAYIDSTVTAPQRAGMRMRLRSLDFSAVKLVDFSITASTVIGQPASFYVLPTVLAGRANLTIGDAMRQVPQVWGMVNPPGRPVRTEFSASSCKMLTVVLDAVALENELSVMLGHIVTSPIKFRADFPPSQRSGGHFLHALELLRSQPVALAAMAENPVMARHLSGVLMAGVLLEFPHNFSEALARPAGFQGPRSIRAVIEGIEADPLRFTRVSDLAVLANLSVRALENGFRSHLGTSPMHYVRGVRMARVHEELTRSDPDEVTATTIAHRWGFSHYARFTAEYRARYGCSPAQTLRSR
ncbi:AraC family transcriptional regulator [Streptomyces sp. NPDC002680]|uniref:AraC family transcriptional regulator n=1 Tax=Streptomyces sp. NPDC002680 TaxID=3364659 RepID=UPI00367C9EDB